MSHALHPDVQTSLAAMSCHIDGLMEPDNPYVVWTYTDQGVREDIVTAMTDARMEIGEGAYRHLCVTQWLGQGAAFGDVRYSARDYADNIIVRWRLGATTTDEVACKEVRGRERPLQPDPEFIMRLAGALRFARPVEQGPVHPRISWLDHIEQILADGLISMGRIYGGGYEGYGGSLRP